MARISNLEKARIKLDELLVNHDGSLTSIHAEAYLNQVSEEFNLSAEKRFELRGFKYSRQAEEQKQPGDHESESHENNQDSGGCPGNAEQTLEQTDRNITEADFLKLQDHCQKLEEAISRIAVLTGNGNHLAELGIERWIPGKKHMNKKYA